jgi:hypothetical protein
MTEARTTTGILPTCRPADLIRAATAIQIHGGRYPGFLEAQTNL